MDDLARVRQLRLRQQRPAALECDGAVHEKQHMFRALTFGFDSKIIDPLAPHRHRIIHQYILARHLRRSLARRNYFV